MLKLDNLTVKAKTKLILENLNLSFKAGRTYVIMGPNGSGKSTLAKSIIADPEYEYRGKIYFKAKDITNLSTEDRAKLGLFVSFQNPVELSGISLFDLMKLTLKRKVRILEIKRQIDELAKQIDLNPEVIKSSLNQSVSGGEAKKLEVIQACLLNPEVIVFDEIDTGLDVDALGQIANLIKRRFQKPDKTLIIITHNSRILNHLRPDEVLIMKNGQVVNQGGPNLVKQIDRYGFKGWNLKAKLSKLHF